MENRNLATTIVGNRRQTPEDEDFGNGEDAGDDARAEGRHQVGENHIKADTDGN